MNLTETTPEAETERRTREQAERAVVIWYDASRDQSCSSCGTAIPKGSRAGFDCGAGPKPLCGSCCELLEAARPATTSTEQGVAQPDGGTCTCTGKRSGFTNAAGPGEPERWVCADCRKPTPDLPTTEGETTAHDEPAAGPADTAGAAEPNDAAGAAGAGGDRGTADRRPARRARRGVRAAETAGGRADGTPRSGEDRDEDRDARAVPAGDDQRDPPQPAPAVPVAGAPGDELAGRHEVDEAGRPEDVRAVGDGVDELADGPGEVTAPDAPASAFAAPPAPADLPAPDAPVAEAPGRLAAFMAAVPAAEITGNTAFAARYATELRQLVADYANSSARNMQRHLGPSEIGHACDRQVAGKLAQLDHVNNVSDPWPSIMGTAGHTYMEDVLKAVNGKLGRIRFLTEHRVTPTMGFEAHPGTGDGYDADHDAVIDHKFLGDSSMGKLRKGGPPRHYFVQFLLYLLGFHALGLPVRRIVLLAWPRTGSSLDGLYVWEHEVTEADFEFLRDVIEPELRYRKQWAAALLTGAAQLSDVPASTEDECHFCPFYRPQTANDGGPGCPGDMGTA